jgi:hypothetical protein
LIDVRLDALPLFSNLDSCKEICCNKNVWKEKGNAKYQSFYSWEDWGLSFNQSTQSKPGVRHLTDFSFYPGAGVTFRFP